MRDSSNGNKVDSTVVTDQESKGYQGNSPVINIAPRVFISTAISSLIGASRGYYIGEGVKGILYFYGCGIAGAMVSTFFFSGAAGLQKFRNVDDNINYAVSGTITGGLSSQIFRVGIKNGVIGCSLGGILGLTYGISSVYLYNRNRITWIDYRRYMIEAAKRKPLTLDRKPPPNRTNENSKP
eukprot:gene14428-19364_t